MRRRQQLPSVLISVGVHAAILVGMAMFKLAADARDDSFIIETVVAEPTRVQEEFVQELQEEVEAAETVNFIAGSASTNVGGSEAPLAQKQEIDPEQVMQEPEVEVNLAEESLPGRDTLSKDLGESEVTGEVGAVVNGYGEALSRLTQELIRMMRSNKLLAVWLFDESESMKDDQQDIKQRIGQVYEELELVEKEGTALGSSGSRKRLDDILWTVIASFGQNFHVHTPKPTSDIPTILEAINRIPIDPSGKENMCNALVQAMQQYRGVRRGGRKLVLILVSDESGDDGLRVEEVVQQAETLKAPIYVFGREAVFGSLYAHVRWKHPQTGHVHYLPIRRGPETPFAEQLQYNGFRRRRDAHMSGFGPYEQVRMARESGGIFFQLPHEQENLNDLDNRKFEMLDLREYVPNLSSRREYAQKRNQSEFRSAIWEVIVMLNPYNENNDGLEIPRHEWFHVIPGRYEQKVKKRIDQLMNILSVMAAAQQRLDSVKPLRAKEPSLRWRANYDLIYAQMFAYRVRLFEYAIALDQFAGTLPQRIQKPKTNRWSVGHGVSNMIMPDKAQQEMLNVTPEQLKQARKKALKLFDKVIELHPGTPWARRAEWEKKRKFGVEFREHHHSPPKKRPKKKRPKPAPPPKL